MVKTIARCLLVTDGGTLRTDKLVWVRLARVKPPSMKTPGGEWAKRTLESIVLYKDIFYEPVTFDESGRIVAEDRKLKPNSHNVPSPILAIKLRRK